VTRVARPVTETHEADEDATGRTSFDALGHIVAVEDPDGRATRTAWDLLGRRLAVTRPGAGPRTTVVDAAGAVVEERDARGALTLHAYDARGRRVRRWARDRAGDPITLRERRVFGDALDAGLTGQEARALNLLGRLYRQYDEAGRVALCAYDASGRLRERARQVLAEGALAAGARVDWELAGESPERRARQLLDGREHVTSFGWDARGRLCRRVYPADFAGRRRELELGYDAAGLCRLALDGVVYVERIGRDPAGRPSFILYGNGLGTRTRLDARGRLVRLRTERLERPEPLTFHAPFAPVQDLYCERDVLGRPTMISERAPENGLPNRSWVDRSFAYDGGGRLVSVANREVARRPPEWPWEDEVLPDDPMSMRAATEEYVWQKGALVQLEHNAIKAVYSQKWALAEDGDRLLKFDVGDGFLSYVSDDDGNLVSEASVRHFVWDHAHRLRSFRWQSGDAPPELEVTLWRDPDGQRVCKRVTRPERAPETTLYVDGFEHHTGEAERNWLHIVVGEPGHRWRVASVRSGPAEPESPEAQVRYHLADLEGNAQLTTDDSGQVIAREEYSPWGRTLLGGHAHKRFRFRGAERDAETGLYELDGRTYSPYLARLLSTPAPPAPVASITPAPAAEPDHPLITTDGRIRDLAEEGADHGERQLPHPRPRHRSEPQGGAGAAR
jgi:RHS repeat-associated protein